MGSLVIDNNLQKEATEVFKSMGLTTSEAVEWFFKEVVNDYKPKRNSEVIAKFANSFKDEETGFKTENELNEYLKEIRREIYEEEKNGVN